ncbi:MAG: MMPL family transporter [Clostridiales Family XIII bacterium]|jgi:predicted RND superfamily exporter protein|nr:MMPL family transporter [Clostridiales Family XIII bacterium]
MKKTADFIVNKRKLLLIVMLVLTAVCAFLAAKMETNTDMTKYLSEDSNMQQGFTLMDAWFSDDEENSSIRVMFDDLRADEIALIKEELSDIPYVSSVDYEADDEDYNKDNHTLFVVNTRFDYGTEEELSIERAIGDGFTIYDMAFCNNDIPSTEVSVTLLASAVGMLLVILFIMSASWLEPILFMITIGIAVVINLGTNVVFPYTAEITASIAPILQLALSMDYSIILMNRYRQEKPLHENKEDAMKAALANSFSSIASSALTTVVGLLALVFLSFKLGPELGIILAKGVFVSMLCVFVILPFLILKFDGGIEKSGKKYPHFPMGLFAKLSNKARFAMPVVFVALFVSFYILQGNTAISFTEGKTDPLAGVFPKDNEIVLLYNSKEDEESTMEIVSALEDDERVKSIIGYENTLGEERSAEDMSEAIAEMDDGIDVDEELIRMLYYLYFDGKTPSIKAEDFLVFVRDDVMSSELFSDYMDESMTENIDSIDKFASKERLTRKMTADEMADFFEMDAEDIESLYLYRFTEDGGAESGAMTVSAFADYVVNTVAEDEDYASMFDADTLDRLETLQTYTDKAKMTKSGSYLDTASIIEMDEDQVELLYVYYFEKDPNYVPSRIALDEFVDFMQNDVAKNPMFASYIDDDAIEQMDVLEDFADKTALRERLSFRQLAGKLGMEEEEAELIGVYRRMENKSHSPEKMTLREFIAFMRNEVADNPMFSSYIDADALEQMDMLAELTSKKTLGARLPLSTLANMLGIEKQALEMVYMLYQGDSAVNVTNEMQEPVPLNTLAGMLGTGLETAEMLYFYHRMNDPEYAPEPMRRSEFLSFAQNEVIGNKARESYIGAATLTTLAAIQAAPAETGDDPRSYAEIAAGLGIAEGDAKAIFVLAGGRTGKMSILDACTLLFFDEQIHARLGESEYERLAMRLLGALSSSSSVGGEAAMPIETLVSFILSNSVTSAMLDGGSLSQLRMLDRIIKLAKADAKLSHREIADALEMDAESIRSVFILADGDAGTISIEEAVSFILSNDDIKSELDSDSLKQLRKLDTIIGYALNDGGLSHADIAELAEMPEDDAKMLLAYRDAENGEFENNHHLSVQQVMNFLIDNKRDFKAAIGDNWDDIKTAQKLINAAVEGTPHSPSSLARLLGMRKSQVEDIYLLYISEFGDTSAWRLSPQEFVNFTVKKVLPNEAFSTYFDDETTEQLKNGKTLIDAVVSEKSFGAKKMGDILAALSDDLTQSDIEMLYSYYAGMKSEEEDWRMTIPQMFDYLCDEVMNDAEFSDMFDRQTKNDIISRKADLDEGIAQMKGENYSRLIFTTDYPEESAATSEFVTKLDTLRKSKLDNDSYMIGASAMVYEMENGFPKEFAVITILTAVAIFAVVFLAFRNLVIPLLLTLLVQCGVFITVTSIGWQGLSVYYLSLLNVQSILMGATIDYAIVFSEYYRNNRGGMGRTEALKSAYDCAIHTIMTSGAILILVTAILGAFSPAGIIAQVCTTLSIGSLIAVLLILLVLPGMLAAFDRFIVKKKERIPAEIEPEAAQGLD